MTKPFDPASLPPHFDAAAAESRWDQAWSEAGVYHWDEARSRDETFVVDTPPPTVSGSLHMGHVFSYTHTDVITRQRRMRGQNVFYPMGWDDNGLPTERRVQNVFHVRCDAALPYEPGLSIPRFTGDDKARKETKPRVVSRRNFIELCHEVTSEDEKAFEALFRRIGLSVDWRQTYATIDDRCRHIAQLSFLDLVEKKQLYNVDAPTMWDVDFQTALASADLVDVEKPGAFHHVKFAVEGTDESFVIATTRPELLPACVAVCAHPDDERFQKYFGKRAITPIFRAPVRIFPSELADPKKGTGILMVCTFGDATDVIWWREQKLPTRQILQKDGRVKPVEYGTNEFPSLDATKANAAFAQLVGKSVSQAQKLVVEMLRDPANSALGEGHAGNGEAPLQGEPIKIMHAVKQYEKGERPLEFITTRQWFTKLIENQPGLLAKGREVKWWPEYMHSRFHNWTEGLNGDWCVSRQRYFGVPIPVWYRLDASGAVDYAAPIFPTRAQLPCDPMSDAPEGFTESQRNQPGGFAGDPDVFDTWFTSSLTPQISSHWGLDPSRHAKLFPADIRPQSHEIIRTWAFYTIAKAMLHEGKVPWTNVVISGWILDPDRKKMSKSVGNVVTPMKLLEDYTADGVRYWAASARLGTDTAFDEKVLKVGKRLVTKLFNAGKYVLAQSAEGDVSPGAIREEIDRAFIEELRGLVTKTTAAFDEFEYAQSLMLTEQFFWSRLTDSYLEIVKIRARGEVGDPASRRSAVATLRLALNVLLRLFAPVVPYITEEVWSWVFADETGQKHIHRAPWPTVAELASIPAPKDAQSFQLACDLYASLNKKKTESGASTGRVVNSTSIAASATLVTRIAPVLSDVLAAAKVKAHTIGAREPLADADGFVIDAIDIAPKEAKADDAEAAG
ncbi:MAG: valine--tRNA ligase [Deltaproteobacteria bacterium]|nr:valine--tRNA ligase [Deltaproteobacteria bacterium]